MSLELVHGLRGVFAVYEGYECKSARLHRLLVLREVYAADSTEGREQLLQVGLGGILRDVRDAYRILIAIAAAVATMSPGPPSLGSGGGEGGEGLAAHASRSATAG